MLSVGRDRKGRYVVVLVFPEAGLLRALPERLRELLTHPDKNRNVIRRLFPAAYRDAREESEYRRLLGNDLLESKRAALETFERSLDAARMAEVKLEPERGSKVSVPALVITFVPAEFDLWLGFVNDMRLTLGVELDIKEDGWSANPAPDDGAEADDWRLLHLLSWLEEELLRATGSG